MMHTLWMLRYIPPHKNVQRLLSDSTIANDSKLILVLLYAIRYEKTSAAMISEFTKILQSSGIADDRIALIPAMLQYAGAAQRMDDFVLNDIFSKTKNVFKGLQV